MRKIIFFLAFILFVFWNQCLIAQVNPNLVSNPSFENFTSCPDIVSDFFPNAWSNYQFGSADYYNSCDNPPFGSGTMGVPNNIQNFNTPVGLNAITGQAHCGILTKESIGLIEFIYTTVQLSANVNYDISFNVSLASVSQYATPIMVAVTQSNVSQIQYSSVPSNDIFTSINAIDNSGTWQQLNFTKTVNSSGTYYIMIGNFSTSNSQISVTNDGSSDYGYYYIDDVVVKEHAGCCPENLTISNTTLSSTQTFGANNSITVGPAVDVSAGANINFIAGNHITFLPGFSGGPNVTAMIGECPGQFQQVSHSPIATIVTPDGDGITDEVCVNILGSSSWSVEVTGLLGQLVYTNGGTVDEEPECIWNGTCNNGAVCNNAVLPAAFYIITLTLVDCNGEPTEFIYLVQLQYPGLRIANTNPTTIDSLLNSLLKIFPNPASDKLFIEFPNSEIASHTISIYDSQGRITIFKNYSEDERKIEIDLNSIENGIYFIQVRNPEGKIIESERIIKIQ